MSETIVGARYISPSRPHNPGAEFTVVATPEYTELFQLRDGTLSGLDVLILYDEESYGHDNVCPAVVELTGRRKGYYWETESFIKASTLIGEDEQEHPVEFQYYGERP